MKYKTLHTFSIYLGTGTTHYTIKTVNKIHYKAWIEALHNAYIAISRGGAVVFGFNKHLVLPLLESWQDNPATGIFMTYCADYATDKEEEQLLYKITMSELHELLRTLGKSTA